MIWDGSLLSSLKVLLFLSSQIFQHKNLGVYIHVVLRRFFLLRSKGKMKFQRLIISITEFGKLTAMGQSIILQTSWVKSQWTNRCSIVSSAQLHSGQRDGPSHPLLMRLSLVKILLWSRDQMKMSIFGIDGKFQRAFHGPGFGGTQGISRITA